MVFESLEAQLQLDSGPFNKELDSAEREVTSFGDRMADIGGRMQSAGKKLSLGLTVPLASVGALSLKTASDVEEMQSKSEAVFGELTEDVRAWAKATAEEMGRSRFQLEKMASGFQDLLVPMGATRKEGTKMSQQLTTLSQDLSSFNNIPAEQVQRDLQAALTGSSETMKKYGVDVSAAAVNQELLNQGIKGGREEATRLQEAQARMNIIMQETADAQGNAADTSGSFANQMRALKADTKELRAEIGQKLIPIAKSLVSRIRPLIRGFGGLSDRQQKVVIIVGALVAALGPLLALVGTMLTMLPMMATGFAMVSAAAAPVTLPILAIVAAIGLLATAFATDFMGIRTITEQVIGRLRELIGPFLGWLRAIWQGHFSDIAVEVRQTAAAWKAAIAGFINWAQPYVQAFLGVLSQFWSSHGADITATITTLLNGLKRLFTTQLSIVKNIVVAFLRLLRLDFKGAGKAIEAAVDAAVNAIVDLFRWLADTLVGGSVVPDMLADMLSAWYGWQFEILGAVGDLVRKFVGKIVGLAKRVVGLVGSMASDAHSALTGKFWKFKNAGKALIQGFIDGIKQKAGAVGGAVEGVVSEARKKLPFSPAEEGPLSDLDESGEAFVDTFAEGIRRNLGQAAGASEAMAAAGRPSLAGAASAAGGKSINVNGDIVIKTDTDDPESHAKGVLSHLESEY